MEENTEISLFQRGNIHIENDVQNLEEAEDIEDQKRLQGEMQNLLINALDDFNFEDQSTFNSSTNVSLEEFAAASLNAKYKNASLDDQIKVLYEVRVKEVKSLQEQVEKQKLEMGKENDILRRNFMLAEANKERAELSLNEATKIIVDKTARLTHVTLELKESNKSFENLKIKHAELLEENAVLKNINQDILEQKDMIQKGFSKSSVSERILEEKHAQVVQQLRSNVDSLNSGLQRKEKENDEQSRKYNKLKREKDDLMIEKSSQINSLSDHLQSAQKQCRDLIEVMEQLSEENARLKKSPSNISESIRIMGLKDQSDMINALHKELEKTKDSQRRQLVQFEQSQRQSSEKVKECNHLKEKLNELETFNQSKNQTSSNFVDKSIYMEHTRILQEDNNLLNGKIAMLKDEIELLKKYEEINLDLKDKVNVLETQFKSLEDDSKNRSFLKNKNYNELENEKNLMEQNFVLATSAVQKLEQKIIDHKNQLEKYELKMKLHSEREELVKNLQEKAAQFESYLKQQKKLEKEMFSDVGINTEHVEIKQIDSDNEDLIREKYEGDLITKEIHLRQELQKEFSEKLDKYAQELAMKAKSVTTSNDSFNESCKKCERKDNKLMEMEAALTTSILQIKKISQERTDDRESIAKLLSHWKDNFEHVEKQKIMIANKLITSESRIKELQNLLQMRENGDADLLDRLKDEVETAIQIYNKKVLTDISNMAENQLKQVTDVHRKMDEISINTEKQIHEIEKKYASNVKSYCVKQTQIKRK